MDDDSARPKLDASSSNLQLVHCSVATADTNDVEWLRWPQVWAQPNDDIVHNATFVDELAAAPNLVQISKHGRMLGQRRLGSGDRGPRMGRHVFQMTRRQVLATFEARAECLPHACNGEAHITHAMRAGRNAI